MVAAVDDPLASAGGQFPLAAPHDVAAAEDVPSPVDVRAWGLRGLTRAVPRSDAEPVVWGSYDHGRQLRVDAQGAPVIRGARRGDPSADTTATKDGEDGPSSEDWFNDFAPDWP